MNGIARVSSQALLANRTGLRSVATHLTRALGALGISYLFARWLTATLYEDEAIRVQRLLIEILIHLAIAGLALTMSSAIPIRRDLMKIRDHVADNERELTDQSDRQRFLRNVQNAFEMAEHEDELYDVTGLALAEAGSGRAEILVADASYAHVNCAVVATGRDAPGCGVTTPGSCPAVRRGQTMRFADPNGLASCPRLRERQLPEGSVATCVPVTVLGTPTAVLHAVCDRGPTESQLAEGVRHLEGIAVRFGARLGMLRAMSQSRLQADTDPLTGLLNRRAMENRVRELRIEGIEFALTMIDIDHFKQLNDTFGHDTGDRALRLFSRVMRTATRDADIVARHGGEEFVIVLPRTDIVTAAPVLHRLRSDLKDAFSSAQVPPFTVSMGLVDSTLSDDLTELLRAADRALLQAKAEGRDRLVIDNLTIDATASAHMPTLKISLP